MAEDREPKNIAQVAQELWDLLVAYAKQETVEPLKGLGRYLAFGVGGAALLGIGAILLTLAGLRALQTETGSTFTGNWSWAPYGISFVGAAVSIGLVLAIGMRNKAR